MKKLVIVSNESIFSGVVRCGIAEMVDCLANSLSLDYDVYIVCPDGKGLYARGGGRFTPVDEDVRKCRFSNVNYYLIEPKAWVEKSAAIVNDLNPDILHNIAEPEFLSRLSIRPTKAICTFDSISAVHGKEAYFADYDAVTVHSVHYAEIVKKSGGHLAEVLAEVDFRGVNNGVLDTVFTPQKGLFLPAKFSSTDQDGKKQCKERLKQTYGIAGDPCIYLMMCRLVQEKNIDAVLDAVPVIKETGGILLVVGKGSTLYEKRLREYTRNDGVIYVNRWASPLQAAPLTGGADFFLQPSLMESGGLMPMTASTYGAIPIVTLNGGLADNFNQENAIIADEQGLDKAIYTAAKLYSDKDALADKRRICMDQDFSWNSRKRGYIELYEK